MSNSNSSTNDNDHSFTNGDFFTDENPHIKLWAVIDGPSKVDEELLEDFSEYNPSWFLRVRASGPEDHEEVSTVELYFESFEEAQKVGKEIDFSNEPIVKEII